MAQDWFKVTPIIGTEYFNIEFMFRGYLFRQHQKNPDYVMQMKEDIEKALLTLEVNG